MVRKATKSPLIGVLAMQGAFAEHVRALEAAGARTRLVRTAADLERTQALIGWRPKTDLAEGLAATIAWYAARMKRGSET